MHQFCVEFGWSRDPQRRFEIRTVNGERVIATNVTGEKFPLYRPLVDAEARPMLLAFANVQNEMGALAFVNKFGALTRAGMQRKGDPVRVVVKYAKQIRTALELSLEAERDELEGFVEDHEDMFRPLALRLVPPLDPGDPLRMVLDPDDLAGALSFLLAERLASGTIFRRCPLARCGEIFDVGEGTDRTLKTRFCSKDHRIEFNSLKRSEGK